MRAKKAKATRRAAEEDMRDKMAILVRETGPASATVEWYCEGQGWRSQGFPAPAGAGVFAARVKADYPERTVTVDLIGAKPCKDAKAS